MKRRYALCCGTLGVLFFVICVGGTCAWRQASLAPRSRVQLEQLKVRVVNWAGQVWFDSEEFAAEVGSHVASRFAANRNRLFPGAGQEPLPGQGGVFSESVHLVENDAEPIDREDTRTGDCAFGVTSVTQTQGDRP